MKKFLFITDFDGTITAQDFFLQILYRFEHKKLFSNYKKAGVELLADVLESANLTEEEFEKEIKHIPLDCFFVDFYSFVEKIGGKIIVLSAGSKYYIEKKLALSGLNNVKIIANGGCFKDGKFKFLVNENKNFYCEKFGVDKFKVVKYYKKEYEKIFYAGDSSVDFKACEAADFRFAKRKLSKVLKMLKMEYFEFENFNDVKNILNKII